MSQLAPDLQSDFVGPFDMEAERALLAIVMLNPYEMLEDLAIRLSIEDFFIERHQWVWSAIADLYKRRAPIDFNNIATVLGIRKRYDELGGMEGLNDILTPPISGKLFHGDYYLRRIKDLTTRRKLKDAARDIVNNVMNERDTDKAVARAQSVVADVADSRTSLDDTTLPANVIAKEVLDESLQWAADPQDIRGMQCGLWPVDMALGGLEPNLFYEIAARPGMGKSSLLAQMTKGYASNGYGVLIFSLEMNRRALVRRMACQIAHVNNETVKQGKLTKQQATDYYDALEVLKGLPFMIEQRAGITVRQMESIIRRHSRNSNIDIVMIDTLNRVKAEEGTSRYEKITGISNALADMAHNGGFALVCALQLNRANTQVADKRPTLADLRDSGALEEDADFVGMLHRPWYYDKSDLSKKDIAEFLVHKNRDGESGNMGELSWDGPSMSFGKAPDKITIDLDDYMVAGRSDSKTDN